MRRVESRAVPTRQTPSASLTYEDQPHIGRQLRPGSTKVMRAGPPRSGKTMAKERCRCTGDRESLRGLPGSDAAELAITVVFS